MWQHGVQLFDWFDTTCFVFHASVLKLAVQVKINYVVFCGCAYYS